MTLLEAARIKAAELAQEVAKARESEAREIRTAAETHGPIGNGYWEARHHKELRLRAAQALVEALAE